MLFVPFFAAMAGILTHTAQYHRFGLVVPGDGGLFCPPRKCLAFRHVDMPPRKDCGMVAALQAIYGYLSPGAPAGVAVALFNRR